jgi:hypothetical protein
MLFQSQMKSYKNSNKGANDDSESATNHINHNLNKDSLQGTDDAPSSDSDYDTSTIENG